MHKLDTTLEIETPEGVNLRLRCAGWAPRFYAFLIDALIRVGIMLVCGMVFAFAKGLGSALYLIMLFAVEWFYPVVFELSPKGATPGKRALGLRVVMDNGLPVTPAASLLRNLLRTVDFLPLGYAFGGVTMMLSSQFKRIGDLAAGTLVVHDEAVKLHGTFAPATPTPPARQLSPREQAAILAWALRAPRLTPARADELAVLCDKILPAGDARQSASERLLAVANHIAGHRV